MRIALMGTRGIPANYGGFETFYENLAPRLAERGHDVSVYIRPHRVGQVDGREYLGVTLVRLPSIRTKHLETISHTLLSVLHGLSRRYDIVYICGVGNTPVAWVPRLGGAKVVLNVDSADWKRKKWGRTAALYLRLTERFAGRVATVVVADSQVIQARYRDEYHTRALFLPYGANLVGSAAAAALARFGVQPRRYVLWVGRLEPEARAEDLVEAFLALGTVGLKLVIVGDAPFSSEYRRGLTALASDDVIFTGYQFGDAYRELGFHALAYVQTSASTGTSPALLDQMAAGGLVIARGTPTNLEVIGDAGLAYPPDDPVEGLTDALRRVVSDPDLAEQLRAAARARVASVYSWDRIVDEYEALFHRLLT